MATVFSIGYYDLDPLYHQTTASETAYPRDVTSAQLTPSIYRKFGGANSSRGEELLHTWEAEGPCKDYPSTE